MRLVFDDLRNIIQVDLRVRNGKGMVSAKHQMIIARKSAQDKQCGFLVDKGIHVKLFEIHTGCLRQALPYILVRAPGGIQPADQIWEDTAAVRCDDLQSGELFPDATKDKACHGHRIRGRYWYGCQ